MNSDTLKGKWKELKGVAKERWGRLTDNDLESIDGQLEQLTGKVQQRYGIAREEAQKQIDEWKVMPAKPDEFEERRKTA
ncbi:MAG: CsbD family protein [Terriglobales bacterium]